MIGTRLNTALVVLVGLAVVGTAGATLFYEQRVDSARQQTEAVREEKQELNATLQETRQELEASRERLREINSSSQTRQTDLSDLAESLNTTESRLEGLQENLTETRSALADAQERVDELEGENEQLSSTVSDLREENRQLQSQTSDFRERIRDLQRRNEALNDGLDQRSALLTEKNGTIADLEGDREVATDDVNYFCTQVDAQNKTERMDTICDRPLYDD